MTFIPFWMIYLKLQLKYTPYIHNSTSLTDVPLHKAIAYTCTFSLHTHKSRSLTQKERCTSLGPARWGSAGTASVELWPVHWRLLPWRRDSSSVGSTCPSPVWHRSLYPRRPGQLAVSITCNMIPGQYDTDTTGQRVIQKLQNTFKLPIDQRYNGKYINVIKFGFIY